MDTGILNLGAGLEAVKVFRAAGRPLRNLSTQRNEKWSGERHFPRENVIVAGEWRTASQERVEATSGHKLGTLFFWTHVGDTVLLVPVVPAVANR